MDSPTAPGREEYPSGISSRPTLSVVVPAFNESAVLDAFHERLSRVLQGIHLTYEILYVNDGSTDPTLEKMRALRASDPHVGIVDLSRNYGKEIALTAGLDHARGDAVVVIDADLQDPPELIPELIAGWREGYDMVYARRIARDGEGVFKRLTAYIFYRVLRLASRTEVPADTGDFRLLSRRAVDALKTLREHHRFMKGLFHWVGFDAKEVRYRRDARWAGKTKWNYRRLWNLAVEGITSHTTAPLRLATILGLAVAAFAFLYAAYIAYDKIVHGNPVAGYPSLMVTILFLGGVQLVTMGIIGEYLGRVFNETKGRPLYFVKEYRPAAGRDSHSSDLLERTPSSPTAHERQGAP